jgi:putative acetyltransferase
MNMTSEFTIRRGQLGDLAELQKLFLDTITEVCRADYNEDQIHAWIFETKSNENRQRWIDILENQFVLVAQNRNEIVGFITLYNGHYIDLLYVHKGYQRKAIAKSLYKKIEHEARRQNQTILTANVSITARPFFEEIGFKVLNEQTVLLKNVELTNYKMEKKINPDCLP